MPEKIHVSVGIDVDAVGGWLGSYGGEDSPGDVSRGLFAGEVMPILRAKVSEGAQKPAGVAAHACG